MGATGTAFASGPAMPPGAADGRVRGWAGSYNRPMSEKSPAAFGSMTLRGFIDVLASPTPSPGGGAASAVAASCAAALVAMVSALSADRPKYLPYTASHARHGGAGRELAARLLVLADEDAAAYADFAAALKLPRETDAERQARQSAIRAAALEAADAPLRTLEACRDIVAAAEALAGRSNLNAASDLSVASRIAEAAAHGAAENVIVNLPSLDHESLADELRARVGLLLAEIEDLAEATRAHVERRELREPEADPVGEAGPPTAPARRP